MKLVAASLSLAFALLCASSLTRESGTWDEYLLGLGLRRDLPDALSHPPLSSWVHGVPFLWLEIPDAVWEQSVGPLRGQQIVALRSDDWMLDLARLALLPFGVALGWIAFAWGRHLYGYAGGLVAMALVCFDPNVIAHAGLITPDVTLAATAALSSASARCVSSTSRPSSKCSASSRSKPGASLGSARRNAGKYSKSSI